MIQPVSGFVSPLFVPADRSDRFDKASQYGADAVIIDLEDAVAPLQKAAGRANLRLMPEGRVIVRINGAGTPWHEADIEAVAELSLSAVMIPKAEQPEDLRRISKRLSPGTALIPLVETALGLARASALAAVPMVGQLAFGSIDFCADVNCGYTRTALLHARSQLVMASRLAGIAAALDGVTQGIDDPGRAEDDARHAAELGFGGKLCIHPRQVEPVRRGFAPSVEDVAWARAVLTSAPGAVAVSGVMVDEPERKRAAAILTRSAAFQETQA